MRKIAMLVSLAAAAAISGCASRQAAEVTPPTTEAPPVQEQRPQGPVPGSAEDFRASSTDTVFFALDSSDLSAAARSTLEGQAAWLRRYPAARILVAGNCDERGTREYNIALGARRAEAARQYLQTLGVQAARIETVSYGKERPRNPASNEDAWAQNRNAHTQVVSGAVS